MEDLFVWRYLQQLLCALRWSSVSVWDCLWLPPSAGSAEHFSVPCPKVSASWCRPSPGLSRNNRTSLRRSRCLWGGIQFCRTCQRPCPAPGTVRIPSAWSTYSHSLWVWSLTLLGGMFHLPSPEWPTRRLLSCPVRCLRNTSLCRIWRSFLDTWILECCRSRPQPELLPVEINRIINNNLISSYEIYSLYEREHKYIDVHSWSHNVHCVSVC